MSRFDSYPDRALELADRVGDSLKNMVPGSAGRWLETGAKLGALKGGARVATAIVRRNPAIAIATVAGAGLLWYEDRDGGGACFVIELPEAGPRAICE